MNANKKLVGCTIALGVTCAALTLRIGVLNTRTNDLTKELNTQYERQEESSKSYLNTQKELISDLNDVKQNLKEAEQEIKDLQPTEFKYRVVTAPIFNIPLSVDLQRYTYTVCDAYGIADKYELILAQMWHESNFDPGAISSTDDYGLMQINKVNHDSLSKTLFIDDFLNPEQNIHAGIYIMCNLLSNYNGDEHKALMAYNMGPTGAAALWENNIYSSDYSRSIIAKTDKLNNYYDCQ